MKHKNELKLHYLRFVRLLFKITERVSPPLAKKWAIKLFFSPVKFDFPEREKKALLSAKPFNLNESGNIKGYEWGQGPTVLFMHGWAGRATQVVHFIEPLVAAGFKVIALDAPAHGNSFGKETNILEFKESILELVKKRSPIYAAIGHSLGGTALLFARKEGMGLEKLVVISVPSIGDSIIQEFLKRIGASAKIGTALQDFVFKKFNQSFDEFSALSIVSDDFPPTNLFIIHDENDKEAPIVHFEKLSQKFPEAKKMITHSLGHTRILRNEQVIASVVDFLRSHESTVPNVTEVLKEEK